MRHNNAIREELEHQAVKAGDDSTSPPNSPQTTPSGKESDTDQGDDKLGTEPTIPPGTSRQLEFTRTATRRRPNASDTVDATLAPSSLTLDICHRHPDPAMILGGGAPSNDNPEHL